MKNEKTPFKDILDDVSREMSKNHDAAIDSDDAISEDLTVIDILDHEILMHRDAHFGGKFDFMLDYYRRGGKGVYNEFEVSRIEELAIIEKDIDKDLAALVLLGVEAEEISRAKSVYSKLRELYEGKNHSTPCPRLIADMILSEEEDAIKETEAVIAEGSGIVSPLIDLLCADEFYSPLFPGYGLAPALAAQCLGKIGDEKAIIPLFEALSKVNFFIEDAVLTALENIGVPAKEFLLNAVKAMPISSDNERAAMALTYFKDDSEVSKVCFEMLKNIDIEKHPMLAMYLVLTCESLDDKKCRQEFIDMSTKVLEPLRHDMSMICRRWQK